MEHSDIEHMAQGYPPAHIAKDSEEVIVWLATQLLATQEQCDALAAENLVLKVSRKGVVNAFDDAMNEFGMARGETAADYPAPETPATNAYHNSVRAEGVEILTGKLQKLIDEGTFDAKEIGVAAGAVYEGAQIAARLRAGEPS